MFGWASKAMTCSSPATVAPSSTSTRTRTPRSAARMRASVINRPVSSPRNMKYCRSNVRSAASIICTRARKPSTPTEMTRNAESPACCREAPSNCAPRRVSCGFASATDRVLGLSNLAGTDEQAPSKPAADATRIASRIMNVSRKLVDFLGDPKARLSPLIQSDAKQCRLGFQEARNGQSLPANAQRKNFRLTHRSEFRLAYAQGGALLIAIIRAEICLADIQMVDRGGKGC